MAIGGKGGISLVERSAREGLYVSHLPTRLFVSFDANGRDAPEGIGIAVFERQDLAARAKRASKFRIFRLG